MPTNWTEIICRECAQSLLYEGRGRPPEFCGSCGHLRRRKQVADNVRQFTGALDEDVRKHMQAARKYLSKKGYSRSAFLNSAASVMFASYLEASPSNGGKSEYLHERFLRLRHQLALGDHVAASTGTSALREYMKCESLVDSRVWLGSNELIRDAGIPLSQACPLALAFRRLDQLCEDLAIEYAAKSDYPRLAVNLLTRANLHRSHLDSVDGLGSFKTAKEAINAAEHVAIGLCRKNPATRDSILHQAISWRCRLQVVHAREHENAGADIQRLKRLAESIDSPPAWLETWRETFTYHRYMGELDQANAALEKATQVFSGMPVKSPWNELGLLRSRILLLQAVRAPKSDQARVVESYVALCSKYPSIYQRQLAKEFGVPVKAPAQPARMQLHLGAMLPFFYLESLLKPF